jgi:prepilin peptidase dependent protein A
MPSRKMPAFPRCNAAVRDGFLFRHRPLAGAFLRLTLARMNRLTGKQQGMSLLEMLVVMGLIAILTGSSLYYAQEMRQAHRLRQSAQALQTFLGRMQAQANSRNEARLLAVTLGPAGCVTQQSEPPAGCGGNGLHVFRPGGQGVSIVGFSGNGMGFYGLRNTAQPGHLTLGNAAGRIRVVLSGHGRLRLCGEDAVSGVPLCR